MKSIDSLPGIATMGHPLIPPGPHAADRTPRELVGIMADRFGRPSGESWRGRVDGPSSTRWRPGQYGWSEEGRTMTERQVLECFVTANDPGRFQGFDRASWSDGPRGLPQCPPRAARRRGRLPGYVPGLGQGCAHNQAQRDHRPVAPSSGPPHGTEGTVQGLSTSGSRKKSHRLQNGVSHRPTRLPSHPVTPRRGRSLAGKLQASCGALLLGGEYQPGGRGSVEMPGWDDQGAALEGAANLA